MPETLSKLIASKSIPKQALRLTLRNIEVKDLTDLGSFLDKQDPGVVIKIGSLKTFETER